MEFQPQYDNSGMAVVGLGQHNPIPAYPYCLSVQSAIQLAVIVGGKLSFDSPFGPWSSVIDGAPDQKNPYQQLGKVPFIDVEGVHANAGLLASYWYNHGFSFEQALAQCMADIEARKTDTTA